MLLFKLIRFLYNATLDILHLEYTPTTESSANTEPETNGFGISNFIVLMNVPLLYCFGQKNKLVVYSFFIPSGSTKNILVRASAASTFFKTALFVLQTLLPLFLVLADTVTSIRPTTIGLILNLNAFDFPPQTHKFVS